MSLVRGATTQLYYLMNMVYKFILCFSKHENTINIHKEKLNIID